MEKINHFLLIPIITLIIVNYGSAQVFKQEENYKPKGTLIEIPEPERSLLFQKKLQNSKDNILFFESFETPHPGWSLTGSWSIGLATSAPCNEFNSSHYASTNLSGNYQNNANDWLISPEIDLPDSDGIFLNFKRWYQLESGYDYVYVKITTDNGESWKHIGSISGSSSTWNESNINISAYSGSSIKIGFHLISDSTFSFPGLYISDLSITYATSDPLSVLITSLNPQNFPFIYMNAIVDTNGVGISTLSQQHFSVHENNFLQSDYFEVIPPDQGGGSRLVDVVFIMDNSGSMGPYITAIYNNVIDFVDGLSQVGVDYGLGLCRYGQSAQGGNPIVEDNGVLTSDPLYFKEDVWQRNVTNGGTEPGYYAIVQSANSFSFRPGSLRIFIIITDETPNQGGATLQNAIDACLQTNVTLFAVTLPDLYNTFLPITNVTNGECFNIYSNFDLILESIINNVAGNYIVRYRSNDPDCNGIQRNITLTVNYDLNTANDNTSYMPCQYPIIERTLPTIALHDQAWTEGSILPIVVIVTDYYPPPVNTVRLFYKNTSAANYSFVNMQNISDSTWQANIPVQAVLTPGVDYYILASDGQLTVTDPSVTPVENPYQLAILPNVAPQITHTVIGSYNNFQPLDVIATIEDNTNIVESAYLYYRKIGQLLFQSAEMIHQGGNVYKAIIPGEYCTSDGLQYYLWAKDDFNVGTYHGTMDNPHTIGGIINWEAYIYEKLILIEDILDYKMPLSNYTIFAGPENAAKNFVLQVLSQFMNGTADPSDLEAVARLVLTERVTYEALNGAFIVSEYGAKGFRTAGTSFIFGKAIGKVAKSIGGFAADPLHKSAEKLLDNTNLSLHFFYKRLFDEIAADGYIVHGLEDFKPTDIVEAVFDVISDEVENTNLLQIGTLFNKLDDLLQEYMYLQWFRMFSINKQTQAVESAINSNFSGNLSSTTGVTNYQLNQLISKNNNAHTTVNTADLISTSFKIAGIILLLIAAIILILTGFGVLAGIAAWAGALVSFYKFFSAVSTITSVALGGYALVHVDARIPIAMNQNVKTVFDTRELKDDYPANLYFFKENTDYQLEDNLNLLNDYLSNLKQMIEMDDPSWATSGVDSLNYYKSQIFNDYEKALARFYASADSAKQIIPHYDSIYNLIALNMGSFELYSAALDLTAWLYQQSYVDDDLLYEIVTSIDTLIMGNNNMQNYRSYLENAIQANNIPTPGCVGVGNARLVLNNGALCKIEVEVINYGGNIITNAVLNLGLTNSQAVVVNNNQVMNIPANTTLLTTFDIYTSDSTLIGQLKITPDENNPYYYAMPPKLFIINRFIEATGIDNNLLAAFNYVNIYPNPVSINTSNLSISFNTSIDARYNIFIYNIHGSLLATLAENAQSKTNVPNHVNWDGRLNSGRKITSGMYICHIVLEDGSKFVNKVTILNQ